jgi:hypothetical protein
VHGCGNPYQALTRLYLEKATYRTQFFWNFPLVLNGFFFGIVSIILYLITPKSPINQKMKPERKKELISGIWGIVLLVFVLFVSGIYFLPQATALRL